MTFKRLWARDPTTTLVLVGFVLVGCDQDASESYEVLNNTVPAGGPTLQVDPTTGPANIAQLTAGFSEAEAAVVEQSLAWYGTESRFALSRLQGSTARDLVDVVNCLKQDEGGPEEERCFK